MGWREGAFFGVGVVEEGHVGEHNCWFLPKESIGIEKCLIIWEVAILIVNMLLCRCRWRGEVNGGGVNVAA